MADLIHLHYHGCRENRDREFVIQEQPNQQSHNIVQSKTDPNQHQWIKSQYPNSDTLACSEMPRERPRFYMDLWIRRRFEYSFECTCVCYCVWVGEGVCIGTKAVLNVLNGTWHLPSSFDCVHGCPRSSSSAKPPRAEVL
jgi:hypothetical protein